jgi:hypothetical protein
MRKILYLDQNAWIALAQGAWDKATYPAQRTALTLVSDALRAARIILPLSFTNIYETAKINDAVRRAHLAHVQATISGGVVLRSRRRILEQMVIGHLCDRLGLTPPCIPDDWFLSDLFFEATGDYTPERFGLEIPPSVLALIRQNPSFALFHYLAESDDTIRLEGVRRYSAGSAELIARIEARRQLVAGESFALRRRAYGARLLLDELDYLFGIAKQLDLGWSSVHDIGASLAKSLINDVSSVNS